MTTPAQPDTGAGAEPDTGSAPDDAIDQQPDVSATDDTDWKAEAEKHRALSRKHEQRAKANKQQLDELLSKQQGTPSVEDLQAQTASEREAREAAESRVAELAYERSVDRVARKVGADAEALLDSDRFRREVTDELGDDFDDDDLAKAVSKVAAKFAKDPRFADSKAPARSGADITGGPGAPRQVTEEELKRMSPDQIVEAREKGLLANLLGG
jgi:predicted Zn-dependent protease